jgi:hypothetical protein
MVSKVSLFPFCAFHCNTVYPEYMWRPHTALITSGMTQQFKYHFLWISASWRLFSNRSILLDYYRLGSLSSLRGKTVRTRSLSYQDVCMGKLRKIACRRAGHVFVFGKRYRDNTPHDPCDTRYQVNSEVHSKSDCDIWMAIRKHRFFPECVVCNVNVKLGQHNNILDIILFFLNSRLVVPLRIWSPLSYIIRTRGRHFNRFRVLTREYWG